MNFEGFLLSKKIDSTLFRAGDMDLWINLKILFDQIHEESFVQQKKFIINPLRRKYLLKS